MSKRHSQHARCQEVIYLLRKFGRIDQLRRLQRELGPRLERAGPDVTGSLWVDLRAEERQQEE